jgi:hypothetical protein
VTAAVGFGIYKMTYDAKRWLIDNAREKAPWEREPGGPSA